MPRRSCFDVTKFDRDRIRLFVANATWTSFLVAHPFERGPYYVRFADGAVALAEYAGRGDWFDVPASAPRCDWRSWTSTRPTWGLAGGEAIRSHSV